MKFSPAVVISPFVACIAAMPLQRRDVDPALVPSLGWVAGVNPDGHGNCDGAVKGSDGQPIKVPCACPPDAATFLAAVNENVAAGFCVNNPSVKVSFPTGSSQANTQSRMFTAIDTLQNLYGPGQGCPAASTTLSAQLKAIQDGTAPPPPLSIPPVGQASQTSVSTAAASAQTSATPVEDNAFESQDSNPPSQHVCGAPPASSSTMTSIVVNNVAASSTPPATKSTTAVPTSVKVTSTAASVASSVSSSSDGLSTDPASGALGLSLAQIDALTPQFGHDSGVNPDGTGNCDGAVIGSNGKPILVPCACPPPRQRFIESLAADLKAGHAVNNTGVALPASSFPTDDSNNSQLARFSVASVALQNLNGPGQGCPIVSTTWQAQTKALSAQQH